MKNNILQSTEWFEFENNFEEGWTGNAEVPTLTNMEHHHRVAESAAMELSKTYKCQDDVPEAEIYKMYAQKAAELYPSDRIWWGNESDDPEFWKELHK